MFYINLSSIKSTRKQTQHLCPAFEQIFCSASRIRVNHTQKCFNGDGGEESSFSYFLASSCWAVVFHKRQVIGHSY